MRTYFTICLFMFIFRVDAMCQLENNIEQLNSISSKELFLPRIMDMIEESLMMSYHVSDMDMIPFKIRDDIKIPMVSILFKNVDDSNYEIVIDSCITYSVAFCDKKNNLKYIASFNCGLYDMLSVINKKVYKKVMKQEPDAILYCRSFIDIGMEEGLLYLKNGSIYYYSKKPIVITELINKLSKNMRNQLNYVQVPYLYRCKYQSVLYRRTDAYIPQKENMLIIW